MRALGVCILGMMFMVAGCGRTSGVLDKDVVKHPRGNQLYEQVLNSEIDWEVVGKSTENRDIYKIEKGTGDSTTLIIGGFHGDEFNGVELSLAFAAYLNVLENEAVLSRVVLIPVLNPDGLIRGKRLNANGVDINRNFPTENWSPKARAPRYNPGKKPASEKETRLMMKLIDQIKPSRIISIHAPLEVVNYDGPAKSLATLMANYNGYPISGDIGYPTPGSFGNYAGVERRIPTITLELPGGPFAPMWESNKAALEATLVYDDSSSR